VKICAKPADRERPKTEVGRDSVEPIMFGGAESTPEPLGEGNLQA